LDPQQILISIGTLIFAVVFHELAHGWAAWKLGDPTAKDLGRITLNPIPHIHPFWTIALPAMLIFSGSPIVFGGAKPVPFNPRYFKDPKWGTVLVAAAGPASNFLIAAVSLVLLYALYSTGFITALGLIGAPARFIYEFLQFSILINVVLAFFNLFPVPPLDGGRIAVGLLPDELGDALARVEPYGFFIVIAALCFGFIDKYMNFVITNLFYLLP